MKRFSILLAAAALSVGLAGCGDRATLPPPSTAAPAPIAGTDLLTETAAPALIDAVVLQGNRALTLSALGYDSAAKVAIAAVKVGAIRGTTLDALKELNRQATMALSFGYTATTAAEKARAALTLDGIVKRIRSLAPG